MNLNRRVPNGLPGGVRGRKFYYFLLLDCFHKQTKQTLEVLSFMKLEQIIFVKEAVSFILRKQDILVKEVLSFIMKKQDNFLKEVVSFMKTNVVSPKLTTSIIGLFLCLLARFP